ncbi:ABC transporter ATP-binding protein [Sporosalibacterium faouarense]|uniref:ABC transporter ATP-binding protein n=1 Tax=Sporosalibacterium faouarense TaxID=516123 RepID=UPI00192C0EA2|nr:ABC transporter ATP-binding protein [Sporosalibacterium faouarense]
MSNSILKVNNLRKKYSEFTLKDVSFELPRGYIMGLIGPNGAGKSTTIKLIMNLLKSNGGEVEIFGLNYKNNEEEIKNRIGYVGEEQIFYEDMSVAWTEKFISQYYKKWDKEYFNSLLSKFKVSKTKKIKELSKGMKVKLGIALALARHPELLILDEPTSGLDPVIRKEILDILLEVIQDENKSVLFSSHITEDIEKIADYVTYIINGKIVLSQEKENILTNWKKISLKKNLVDQEIKRLMIGIEENYFGITGITKNYSKIKNIFSLKNINDGIKISNATLDEILISLVREEE